MSDTTNIAQNPHVSNYRFDWFHQNTLSYQEYTDQLNAKRRAILKAEDAPMRERFNDRIRDGSQHATVIFQGEMVKVKTRSLTDRPIDQQGSGRKPITRFSPKARKNMLDTVSRINWGLTRAVFVTLTYHENLRNAHKAKRDLRTLEKRLFRAFGDKAVLWKLEPQKRGAWHFHLIVWDCPNEAYDWFLPNWQEVTGDPTITEVKVEPLLSAKKGRSYVSKYCGKPIDNAFLQTFLLFLLKCPLGMIPAIALDYQPNLPGCSLPGRFWGIENRALIQWAKEFLLTIPIDATFHRFKRAARKHWHGVNTKKGMGFTIYTQNVDRWIDLLWFIWLGLHPVIIS